MDHGGNGGDLCTHSVQPDDHSHDCLPRIQFDAQLYPGRRSPVYFYGGHLAEFRHCRRSFPGGPYLVRGLRGGLAIATIISCALMAAMVGIVGAEIVTFGLIALPQMLERGYDKRIALGSICAGGGMATLIPPSVVFIIYAMTAGASVGELFIGGIIPGLLLAGLFIGYIVVITWINPGTGTGSFSGGSKYSSRKKNWRF